MHYVSVENLSKSFGIKPLFENISFNIEEGDKIAIVARNGSGKSTMLKILAGKETADSGKVWINKDVDVILFEQEPEFNENKSILDNIFSHNHPIINAIKNYELVSESEDMDKLTDAIVQMDEMGAWDFDNKVKMILEKLNIHALTQPVKTLSGGQRKRIALAKTLIDIGFEQKHVLLINAAVTNIWGGIDIGCRSTDHTHGFPASGWCSFCMPRSCNICSYLILSTQYVLLGHAC